jgi:hypothetical protein
MRTMHIAYLISISIILSSCSNGSGGQFPIIGGGSKKNHSKTKEEAGLGPGENIATKPKGSGDPTGKDNAYAAIDTSEWHPALATTISNGAPYGTLICSQSHEVLKYTDYDDFTDLFNVICKDGAPNKNFTDILNTSATATVEPQVRTFKLQVEPELYTTDFIYAFSVKVPVSSPLELTAYPIFEEMSKGLKTADSEVQFKKDKEVIFPGRGVVRSIEQSYSMPFAKGAALYDKRSTLTNTYLLAEGNNDINFVAEHLLGNAEFYNATRQLIFSFKGETPNTTYMVYLNQLVVINRFDPQRLTAAATELSALIPKAVLRAVNKK